MITISSQSTRQIGTRNVNGRNFVSFQFRFMANKAGAELMPIPVELFRESIAKLALLFVNPLLALCKDDGVSVFSPLRCNLLLVLNNDKKM